jgi:hypothetical protein
VEKDLATNRRGALSRGLSIIRHSVPQGKIGTERMAGGGDYGRPSFHRGRPGPQQLNPLERRREWRPANQDRPHGKAPQRAEFSADARTIETIQQQRQLQCTSAEASNVTQSEKAQTSVLLPLQMRWTFDGGMYDDSGLRGLQ